MSNALAMTFDFRSGTDSERLTKLKHDLEERGYTVLHSLSDPNQKELAKAVKLYTDNLNVEIEEQEIVIFFRSGRDFGILTQGWEIVAISNSLNNLVLFSSTISSYVIESLSAYQAVLKKVEPHYGSKRWILGANVISTVGAALGASLIPVIGGVGTVAIVVVIVFISGVVVYLKEGP